MKYLITSALPYVNNVPHLGNLICLLSADVYARFLKSQGKEVISVCGTDEYGTTTQTRAIQEGITPKELTDKYFAIHKTIYEWFQLEFDCLGRTSDPENTEISQDIFLKLHKNGYILQKTIQQFYDEQEQTFLADRFIKGTCPHCGFTDAKGDQCDGCGKLLEPEQLQNPISVLSHTKPVLKETEHLYIDLPKLEVELTKWIQDRESNWSSNARQITHAWLKEKLEPRAITRDLQWGIPVPLENFSHKVFYSWFDAPIGYISITKRAKNDWEKWWKNQKETTLVQFMGKDNTQFHTILFPSFLLGAKDNYTTLSYLSVNEYLNYSGGKFSKSRGTGVFGDGAMQSGICSDMYRYYLIANRPEKEDTVFDWKDFQQKINKELIDNYANLVNRTISFTQRFIGKKPALSQRELEIHTKEIIDSYERIELKQALKLILNESKKANQYFQEKKPWETIKTDKESTENVLANLIQAISQINDLLAPIIPTATQEVKLQIENLDAKPLFTKLEDEKIEELIAQFGEEKKTFPLDLRVAQIISVENHPDADKLYILKLNIGSAQKQIVSGLKDYYTPEELLNKKIILVNNLKPAKLRGIESHGMLLAGENKKENQVKVLEVKFSKPGDIVIPKGFSPSTEEITIQEFSKVKMKVLNKEPLFEKKTLQTPTEKVTCQLTEGEIR